jgi:hypothetical protein
MVWIIYHAWQRTTPLCLMDVTGTLYIAQPTTTILANIHARMANAKKLHLRWVKRHHLYPHGQRLRAANGPPLTGRVPMISPSWSCSPCTTRRHRSGPLAGVEKILYSIIYCCHSRPSFIHRPIIPPYVLTKSMTPSEIFFLCMIHGNSPTPGPSWRRQKPYWSMSAGTTNVCCRKWTWLTSQALLWTRIEYANKGNQQHQ